MDDHFKENHKNMLDCLRIIRLCNIEKGEDFSKKSLQIAIQVLELLPEIVDDLEFISNKSRSYLALAKNSDNLIKKVKELMGEIKNSEEDED
jgi:hypothetical protein